MNRYYWAIILLYFGLTLNHIQEYSYKALEPEIIRSKDGTYLC